MHYVLIIHDVEDYAKWKAGFDEAADLRRDAGESDYQVLRSESDPNRIVHYSKWASLARAKSFFESDEVKAIREKLGVKAPTFHYLDELESGVA